MNTTNLKNAAKVLSFLFTAAMVSLSITACTSTSGSQTAVSEAGLPAKSDGNLKVVSTLPPPPNTNSGADVPIAENDLLEVDVFQVDDLDRTVSVDSRGRISLPLIGSVDVAGKTIPAVEKELEQIYGAKYLQSPEISVFMKESAGQKITMDGEFRKPGIYSITSNMSLVQTFALAGGLSDIADERKIYVFRQNGSEKLVANYNIKAIRAGKQADPRIYGGDVIISFTSAARVASRNLREALGLTTSIAGVAGL
jgi:polysaccharide export outer membrane protein